MRNPKTPYQQAFEQVAHSAFSDGFVDINQWLDTINLSEKYNPRELTVIQTSLHFIVTTLEEISEAPTFEKVRYMAKHSAQVACLYGLCQKFNCDKLNVKIVQLHAKVIFDPQQKRTMSIFKRVICTKHLELKGFRYIQFYSRFLSIVLDEYDDCILHDTRILLVKSEDR